MCVTPHLRGPMRGYPRGTARRGSCAELSGATVSGRSGTVVAPSSRASASGDLLNTVQEDRPREGPEASIYRAVPPGDRRSSKRTSRPTGPRPMHVVRRLRPDSASTSIAITRRRSATTTTEFARAGIGRLSTVRGAVTESGPHAAARTLLKHRAHPPISFRNPPRAWPEQEHGQQGDVARTDPHQPPSAMVRATSDPPSATIVTPKPHAERPTWRP